MCLKSLREGDRSLIRSKPKARASRRRRISVSALIQRFALYEDAFLVGLPGGEEMINDSCEFVSSRGNRFGSAEFRTHSPVVASQVRLASVYACADMRSARCCSVFDSPGSDRENLGLEVRDDQPALETYQLPYCDN